MEIERKWRLRGALPAEVYQAPASIILQGYLMVPTGDGVLRIRQVHQGPATLTIKSAGMLSREEFETVIPAWAAKILLNSTPHQIIKTRYRVPDPDSRRFIEVDVFGGILFGLCLIEVEFDTEAQARAYALPAWAAGAEEVTEDPKYANSSLAFLLPWVEFQDGLPTRSGGQDVK
jgi:adenylate cyclase